MAEININININDLSDIDKVVEAVKKIMELNPGARKTTSNVTVNSEKKKTEKTKFKIKNSEKNILKKKAEIMDRIRENPDTIYAKVVASIFERIRFTLPELREEFPNYNYTTIRSYVYELKKADILHEMDRGKYFVLK